MWHTPAGDRTLQGAEAEVFRELLASVRDAILTSMELDEDPYLHGVTLFDRLATGQQLALLLEVGESLLLDHIPTPPLTAVREAAVAAVFAQLRVQVECEIEAEAEGEDAPPDVRQFWRGLLRRAVVEVDGDDPNLPHPSCNILDDWESCRETLESRVLWDDDWDLEDLIVDSSPEKSEALKDFLCIDSRYYEGIAPDPAESEMPAILKRLTSLIRA